VAVDIIVTPGLFALFDKGTPTFPASKIVPCA
jgi:hypothetical protein